MNMRSLGGLQLRMPCAGWLLVMLAGLTALAQGQYYNPGAMSGLGCVVTGNKLFSHGNYIRDLAKEEADQLQRYRTELAAFQKVIGEAFAHADLLNDPNATLPALPPRPSVPGFCTGNETTLYILGSCTVQNHKIYVSGKFARELNEDERAKLVEFSRRLAATSAALSVPPTANNTTDPLANSTASTTTMEPLSSTTEAPEPLEPLTLDFCTEF